MQDTTPQYSFTLSSIPTPACTIVSFCFPHTDTLASVQALCAEPSPPITVYISLVVRLCVHRSGACFDVSKLPTVHLCPFLLEMAHYMPLAHIWYRLWCDFSPSYLLKAWYPGFFVTGLSSHSLTCLYIHSHRSIRQLFYQRIVSVKVLSINGISLLNLCP